jgi:hypothetical protein
MNKVHFVPALALLLATMNTRMRGVIGIETEKFRWIDPMRAHTLQAPLRLRVGMRSRKPHQLGA